VTRTFSAEGQLKPGSCIGKFCKDKKFESQDNPRDGKRQSNKMADVLPLSRKPLANDRRKTVREPYADAV
jgi:hypothetical protein